MLFLSLTDRGNVMCPKITIIVREITAIILSFLLKNTKNKQLFIE